MYIFAAGLAVYARMREVQLARALADPAKTQRQTLARLLHHTRDTAFGQEHDFPRLKSHADFTLAVPIRDYVTYRPWWQRQMEGEPNVTWPRPAIYYAQTSGTTAGDKFIPVTPAMLRSYRKAGADIFVYLARRSVKRLFDLFQGKFLFLGGSTALKRRRNGTAIGDLSGILAHKIHWPINIPCEPKKEIALLRNWEEKISVLARTYWHADIRGLSAMPSWAGVLFEQMLRYGHFGETANGNGKGALGSAGIWPNFKLLLHYGVNFQPFRSLMAGYLPPDTDYLELYPASEGFFAIQSDEHDPGLQLNIDHGIYYEFIPAEEYGSPRPTRLPLEKVEIGVNYAMVVSTCAGAFAYGIGDTVRFISLRPYKLLISGRTAHFINAFGENVIVEQCDAAITTACRATGAELVEYTAGPVYPGPGRSACHEYLVEFNRPPVGGPEGLQRFAQIADEALQSLNVDYHTKRTGDFGMKPLHVCTMPPMTFYTWLRERGQLGGQHKVPRCANHRDYLDAVLQVAKHLASDANTPSIMSENVKKATNRTSQLQPIPV